MLSVKEWDLDDAQFTLDKYPYENTPLWDDIRIAKCGNCKNYVVGKLHYLLDVGWPIETLRIGICDVEPENRKADVNHAVLVTVLDGKEHVLDQRQKYVVTLDELARMGYSPIEIQREGGSADWVEWLWK